MRQRSASRFVWGALGVLFCLLLGGCGNTPSQEEKASLAEESKKAQEQHQEEIRRGTGSSLTH